MKKLAAVALVLFVAGVLAGPIQAGEMTVTVEGKIVCAKCNLKEEEFKKCQNVLIVDTDGEKSRFYIVMNEANSEFGDVCMAEKEARVTGKVSEKDGRTWIAATEIEILKSEG